MRSVFLMGKVKDLSIWRAHSYLIFERKTHSILFSGWSTEIVRLQLAKGFLGLALNKTLKPYCQSVTNPETKTRPSIQLPNQRTEKTLNIFTRGKTAPWAFAYRKITKVLLSTIKKTQNNIWHAKCARGPEEGPELISWYAKRGAFFQPGKAGNTDGEKRLSDVGKILLVTGPKKDHVSI